LTLPRVALRGPLVLQEASLIPGSEWWHTDQRLEAARNSYEFPATVWSLLRHAAKACRVGGLSLTFCATAFTTLI